MRRIEWKYIRGLNQLYSEGKTRQKITNNEYIRLILLHQKKLIKYKTGNHSIIEASNKYFEFYEKEILEYFNYYNNFFEESGIENNSRKNFTEEDLIVLLFIFYNKEEIKKNITTERKLSARLFKNKSSKYIENKPSLRNAILKLLSINKFPEKDPKNHQWRIVVDCVNPRAIVLCENLDCLKVPVEYKKNNIELWYIGGNNVRPLLDISTDKLQLPIYYFCDWDYHGLNIYSTIKTIFNNIGKSISLVLPPSYAKRIPVDVLHHKSTWKTEKFSKLNKNQFTLEEIALIELLIENNEWIEEESMDLLTLIPEIGT